MRGIIVNIRTHSADVYRHEQQASDGSGLPGVELRIDSGVQNMNPTPQFRTSPNQSDRIRMSPIESGRIRMNSDSSPEDKFE